MILVGKLFIQFEVLYWIFRSCGIFFGTLINNIQTNKMHWKIKIYMGLVNCCATLLYSGNVSLQWSNYAYFLFFTLQSQWR